MTTPDEESLGSAPRGTIPPASLWPERDQGASGFTPILTETVRRLPGALGAVLVDDEGESVDYAGRIDNFDLRLAAAQYGPLLCWLNQPRDLGACRELCVYATERSYGLFPLPGGYCLVLIMGRSAPFLASPVTLGAARRALCAEAGLPWELGWTWYPAEVSVDSNRRPLSVDGAECSVIGIVRDDHIRGFRVRLAGDLDVTLVREAGRFWYADQYVADLPLVEGAGRQDGLVRAVGRNAFRPRDGMY